MPFEDAVTRLTGNNGGLFGKTMATGLALRAERRLHGLFVLWPLDMALAHVPQGTGQETAGTAGRIKQGFARLRVDTVHHEGGYGAGRVVLARIARRLQIVQNLFVDVAEMLAFAQVVEVDLVDLVEACCRPSPMAWVLSFASIRAMGMLGL